MRFQRAARLDADGVVGERTAAALRQATAKRAARLVQVKRRHRRVAERRTVKRRIRAALAGLLRVGLRPETVAGDRRRAVPGDQQEPVAGAFVAVLLMGSALAAAAARMTPSNRSAGAAPAISTQRGGSADGGQARRRACGRRRRGR